MRKTFSHLSGFLLVLTLVFVISGFVLPQTVQAVDAPGSLQSLSTGIDDPGFLDTAFQKFFAWVVGMILKLVSLLTGLSGIVLNGVVYYTVVKISDNYSNIPAIGEAWRVIRDLANMGFIFVLLYVAIRTILGMGDDTKKLIVNIIIVAILINFSLFFTKLVIDASNVLALLFYDAIAPGALNATGGFNLTQAGLSNAFMQHLSLTSLYKASENLGVINIITVGIMGSIMLLIAAFVFFAAAIMFIIRYVILILVIIFSPLAFMGWILPDFKKYWDQWWDALSGQAFFAPIYFMLIWVALHVLGGIMTSFGASPNDTTAALAGLAVSGDKVDLNPGTFAMLINFIVVIVFLIIALIIAKEWADKAGHGVPGLTKWAMGAAGGATLGLGAAATRRTVGAGASRLAQSEGFQRWAGRSIVGQTLFKGTGKVAQSSFDLRATKLGGIPGLSEAGQAQQGGYETTLQKKIEKKDKFAQSLRSTQAKEAYAARIAGGALTHGGSRSSGNSLFGTLGRHNRVVASKIFTSRIATSRTDLNNGNTELTRYQNILNSGNALSPTQAARHAILTGPVTLAGTSGSLADIQNNITNLQNEIARLELNNPANMTLGRPIRADEQNY